jgi:hypothetical protein
MVSASVPKRVIVMMTGLDLSAMPFFVHLGIERATVPSTANARLQDSAHVNRASVVMTVSTRLSTNAPKAEEPVFVIVFVPTRVSFMNALADLDIFSLTMTSCQDIDEVTHWHRHSF